MVGFIRGILWGGVVAVGGLAAVSQLAPMRVPVAEGPETQAMPEPANTTTPPQAAPEATVPEPVKAPEESVPETAAPSVEPEPEVKAAPEAEPAPVIPREPVAEGPPPPQVVDSAPEPQPVTPTEPSPSAPETTGTIAPEPSVKPALGEVAVADPAVEAPIAPQEAPIAPPSEAPQGAMAAEPAADQPQAEVVTGTGAAPAPVAPDVPMAPAMDETPATAELPPPPPLRPEEEALLQPAPETADAPVTAAVEPAEPPQSVLQPAPALTDEAEGVITGRLPRIGEADAPEAVAEAPAEEPILPADDASLPPLQRYARAFDNPDNKPLFAILLQDNGGEVDRAELAALDLPLTVVIDPLSDGAADRAAIWRSGGQEVVLSGESVPDGATPGDLEQIFQALASRLPESVAVIDITGNVFQNNRPLATQIVPILADQGRGLVTFDQGLNAADQVARREGLASATIFRRFDPDGAEAPAVKRYLDRAVFKAAQEGQVAVLGTLTPETIAGLLEWSIEGRASTVAVAPISALLLRSR